MSLPVSLLNIAFLTVALLRTVFIMPKMWLTEKNSKKPIYELSMWKGNSDDISFANKEISTKNYMKSGLKVACSIEFLLFSFWAGKG